MRPAFALAILAAAVSAAPSRHLIAERATGCTYSCPGTNAADGKLLNSVLSAAGILQCTYISGLSSALCLYQSANGQQTIGVSLATCPKAATAACPSTSSTSSTALSTSATSSSSAASSATSSSTSQSASSTSTSSSASATAATPTGTSTSSSSDSSTSASISLPISIPTSIPVTIPTSTSTSTSISVSAPTSDSISVPTTTPTSISTSTSTSATVSVAVPTSDPISIPTSNPISVPTSNPISIPTSDPITIPTSDPVTVPTSNPITIPTSDPITVPTSNPVTIPTSDPISIPTTDPVSIPTSAPVTIPTSVTTSDSTSIPVTVPISIPVTVPTSVPVTIPTSIPVTTSTSSTVSPSSTLSPGWSTAYSCAVDTSSRVLASPEYYHLANNTPLTCTTKCTKRGYSIAAVEYSDECFCANGFTDNLPPAVAPTSECNKPCAGDANQTCGGSFRMQIYASPLAPINVATLPAGWVETMSCGVDTIDRVYADTASATLADNTPAKCIAHCSALGYKMAGVEYGNECYCGSSYRNGTPPPVAPVTQCNFACAGAPSLMCGGSWGIQLYASA